MVDAVTLNNEDIVIVTLPLRIRTVFGRKGKVNSHRHIINAYNTNLGACNEIEKPQQRVSQ